MRRWRSGTPKRDSLFYFDVDSPNNGFPEGQHVQVKADQVLDDFTLTGNERGAAQGADERGATWLSRHGGADGCGR